MDMARKLLVDFFPLFDVKTLLRFHCSPSAVKIKTVRLSQISAIPTISDVNVSLTSLKMLPTTFLKVDQKIDKISYWKLFFYRVMFYLAGFLDGAMADLRFLKEILGVCSSSDYDFPQQINVLKTFCFIYSGTGQVTFSDNSCQ